MKVGDKIRNPGGVNATGIPVGTVVQYEFGADRKNTEFTVCLRNGKRVLQLLYTNIFVHGDSGTITILSFPGEDSRKDAIK